jgi:hypothetical protein
MDNNKTENNRQIINPDTHSRQILEIFLIRIKERRGCERSGQ